MKDPQATPNDRPLRVGYMLLMYPRFSQTFVVNEILELERQGVELCIASLKKPTDGRFHESLSRVQAGVDYIPQYLAEGTTRILRTHWSEWQRGPANYARTFGETLRLADVSLADFRQAALVLKWARKRKLDHVHVHFGTREATVAYLARRLGGLSYSLTLHAFDIFRNNVNRALLARKINASAFTVTVSRYNREYMVGHLPGLDASRVRVNYNGIDLESFCDEHRPRRPLSILGVGRLIEKKGFIHLVRAVRQLHDRGMPATCTLVGDGPEKERLKHAIHELKLRKSVRLAGSLPQQRVRQLLQEAACFALPCVTAADGNVDALPTVLLEALACGCPCVSTRLSGVPEIIEDGRSGLLVPPGDEPELAQVLGRVLQDGALAGALAEGGRQRAEQRFDVRRNVGQMKDWFSQVLYPSSQGTGDVAVAAATTRLGAAECQV